MTLRLDAGAAQEMVSAHFIASQATKGGDFQQPDAGEATRHVAGMLDAFAKIGHDLAVVNVAVGDHLRQCTDNINGADIQIARNFTGLGRKLP